jgi:hypothetical protein
VPLPLRDDDAAKLRQLLDLAFDTHDRVLHAVRDAPRGNILVGIANGGDHLIDADAEGRHRVRLDLHQNLAGHAAVDVDAGNAGNVLDALDDHLIREGCQLAKTHRRRQDRQRHDRLLVFLIGANDQWILDVAREAGFHLGDLVADILHRAGHVRGKPEFREHLALALERRRPNGLHAGDGVDRVLDGFGDIGFDDLGRGAGIWSRRTRTAGSRRASAQPAGAHTKRCRAR